LYVKEITRELIKKKKKGGRGKKRERGEKKTGK